MKTKSATLHQTRSAWDCRERYVGKTIGPRTRQDIRLGEYDIVSAKRFELLDNAKAEPTLGQKHAAEIMLRLL